MSPRLLAELQRLFLPLDQPETGHGFGPAAWSDAAGATRVLVLALASEAGWAPVAAVWHGVQTELDLPAPAIAVDGRHALQLWFSLAKPIAPGEAQAWLAGLRQRFLAEVPAHRVAQWPPAGSAADHLADSPAGGAAGGAADGTEDRALAVDALPPQCIGPERWSAFVSADLAPVFAETPWLEIPPGDDAQASLLARLQPIGAGAWAEACARLSGAPPAASTAPPVGGHALSSPTDFADSEQPPHSAAAQTDAAAARRFLRAVMDDAAAPLAARIEAAKALLGRP